MKWLRAGSAALVVLALAGCESFNGLTDLEVTNQNAADRARVLQTWADNENFVLGSFNAVYGAFMRSGYIGQPTTTMADEQTVSWGNYDGRILSSEPRSPYDNSPSYSYSGHGQTTWYNAYEGLSNIYDGLRAFNDDTTGVACVEVDCDRLQAYGKFVQGVGHAMLALFYDSAFVLDETIDLFDDNGDVIDQPLLPYQSVWDSAASYLSQAATLAAGGTWTFADGIFGGSGNRWNGTELARVANSMIAHYGAQLARTPTERANLDWATIRTAATNGMQTDIFLEGDGCDNWCNDYLYFSQITTSTTWNRADYKTIGQYDPNSVAGNGTYGYVDWLNTAIPSRTEFTMIGHPDRRIIGAGDTDGTTNGSDFKYRGPSRFPTSRGTYHFSFYSSSTYEGFPATEAGPMPWALRASVRLNWAEADLRIRNAVTQAIVDSVNVSRVNRGGLPALTTANTVAQVLDAIIYERRIENFAVCHGCAYFHRRGEGPLSVSAGVANGGFDSNNNPIQHHQGLVEGTPLHFAPPGKELEVLQKPIYTYGGVGNELGAGQGLATPPAFNADMAQKYSVHAFYVPAEESLRRKAERANSTKQLVRYVQ